MIEMPLAPQDAAKILLQSLPAKRMRDVVERRFGLKGRAAVTLEEIGSAYHITRERVRQIEADALRRIREEEHPLVTPLLVSIEGVLHDHGGVMAAHHLFSHIGSEKDSAKNNRYVQFLLRASTRFAYEPEDDAFHARWALDSDHTLHAGDAIRSAEARLGELGKPLAEQDMRVILASEAHIAEAESAPAVRTTDAYLECAKNIQKNPYGQYGLATWATITPRGIKDKAYTALLRAGKPLHFREVARHIDAAGWPGRRKAHAQTVHNELIKDGRFILVGRGMYALKEWGYESGTVRDILVSLLSAAPGPMGREEIMKMASERRMVKPQTILLNLQDKNSFRRTDDGKYLLA